MKESSAEFKMLDDAALASRRESVEHADEKLQAKLWGCQYCDQHFQSETRYMNHRCEKRRRHEELISPLGQAAFGFYLDWMRCRKFSQPSSSAFLQSKYYRAFIKFATLVATANITRPDKYISLMVETEVQPVLWCAEGAYSLYTGWYDALSSPMEQVQESINYLFDLSEKEGVSISEIFTTLGVQRLLQLIQQRRLSPWFLFCSKSFGKILKSLDHGDLKSFNAVINAVYWAKRFKEAPGLLKKIKELVSEIGL